MTCQRCGERRILQVSTIPSCIKESATSTNRLKMRMIRIKITQIHLEISMTQTFPAYGVDKHRCQIRHLPKLAPISLAVWTMFSTAVLADESAEKSLPRIEVVGQGTESISRLPGSVSLVTNETILINQPLSTQDAIKFVPGVVVREEEGYGFIPNIGMRGLDPNRSQKLLVLEDGVPIAPSLFISNESYYSPRIERMEGIEVLKGAAGLRYGPTTIGGVINYQTKQPENGVRVTAQGGSHGYGLLGLDAGGRTADGKAIGGISMITSQGDGFRNNGFKMEDIVVKGGIAIDERQWLGAKLTYYTNDVNTSYVGLRKNEYRDNPTKNSAKNDYFISDRLSFDINHEIELNSTTRLKTLAYWSELQRDYWRRPVLARSADGTTFVACGGSSACMVGAKRTFEMVGVDSRLELNHDSFGIKNESEIGIRLHTESRLNKTVSSFTNENARSGSLTANQDSSANSLALYGQNRFIINERVAITPGMRVESYTQNDLNRLNGISGKASNTEFVPGIGATWQVSPQAQVFAGAHRGFSPAMMAASIVGGVDQRLGAERSTNLEIGVRGTIDQMRYEVTAFQMDFANQIVNASTSANITQSNAGKTLHQGLEGLLGIDLGKGWGAETNMTYLPVAEYRSDRLGSSANVNGNRLPYAPELVANVALTYKFDVLTTRLSATHVSSQFVDAANTVAASDDGRRGVIPAYTTLNINTRYALSKQTSLFATVRNLTDKQYIASRNPDGIFPGAERNFQVGISHKF